MITPMTVRNERSLLARKVPRAIQRFSKMSDLKSFINPLEFSYDGFFCFGLNIEH